MRFTIAAAAITMVAGVSAQNYGNGTGNAQATGGRGNGNAAGAIGGAAPQATAYDTVVVDSYTTTCPGNVVSTNFAYNGVTYSATANQVVTVTNCPCTVTAPAGTYPSATPAPGTNGLSGGSGSGAGSASPSSGSGAGASPPKSGFAAGNGSSTPEAFTGGASTLSGAGLAVVFAVAAYAL